VLGDGYGDGWNNGYLTVEQSGSVVATLEAVNHNQSSTQTYDSVTLILCDNLSTDLVWHEGGFDDEVSITVIGPDGTQIFTISDLSSVTSTTIHAFTTDCSNAPATNPTVATIAATSISQTSATLNATITNPDNVTITAKGFEWKATAGGTYTQIAGTGTGNAFTANLTGLTANTGYTYKAFITFNGQTVYGSEQSFTTLNGDVEPCETPTNLHASDVDAHSITIGWNTNGNATSWNIHYRVENGTWNNATSNTNTYVINGLTAETVYEIEVQADCGNGNLSDWSAPIHISTTIEVGIDSWLENSISLYPNPAKDVVNVQCTVNDVQVKAIEVFDVYGKLLQTVSMTPETTTINVSGLASGMYFVRVTTEEGVVTKSFVKK
jgi:hypothetical protein